MELQLKPQANTCFITGVAFQEGQRVVSLLVRAIVTGEFVRLDCLAEREADASPWGEVLCRWTRVFKVAPVGVNLERALKLSAESLLLTLTEDPEADVNENGPLKQFLALMLERKRLVRVRGLSVDGARRVYEHTRTKRRLEVPAAEMDTEFFRQMRDKLGVLLGGSPAAEVPTAATAVQQVQQQQ